VTTFRIADTFTDSLAKLTGDEQKAVKTTAFDLQMNPSSTGMQFHKLDRAKDRNFWSVRVSRDIRLIVHRMTSSLLLCYVGHHDDAYAWAERRKLEVHPSTGAAQLVEVRERVEEVTVPVYVHRETPPASPPPLFADRSDAELLGYGVPVEWLADVRAATEDTIFEVVDHLPQEAAEALLDLAVGVTPALVLRASAPAADPFEHPDAQRRFRVIADVEELTRALDAPWDRWTIFLHPAQRALVEQRFNGPARVSGSAGTGKTVVALHRAVHLARVREEARVLLATFSPTLANALRIKLRRLLGDDPRLADRIEVSSLDDVALRLRGRGKAAQRVPTEAELRAIIAEARAASEETKFTDAFLMAEWTHVVDPWRIATWEAYRDVPRLGRRTRLPEAQRAQLWTIFERVRAGLAARGLTTMPAVYEAVSAAIATMRHPPFDYIVVDEAQDLSVPQLRFVAALGRKQPDALFFAGDLGQRIFQSPFSWRQLGVDIRGRSSALRINYRTSHQIRAHADRLLEEYVPDVDGDDERRDAISVFNGPAPLIATYESEDDEARAVADWLSTCVAEGVVAHEIGVFVRSDGELGRARAAVANAGLTSRVMTEDMDTRGGAVTLGVMHLAKGLEFRAVAVMACDDEVIPLQPRIESVTDQSELEEVYRTERHLLYVACTRARDHLMVSAVKPASEFLDDLVD
jgi:superfamily I DNA/RNA helicase/mRNA-degrading endonuclease RelE of RelBE toxin-antitoxin system